MHVRVIQTKPVTPNHNLWALLDAALPSLAERSVVAIASKVIALCEGRVVPMQGTNKDLLIQQEASHYLSRRTNRYNVTISITRNHLVASGGIDESNADGNYVLWPADLQKSANTVRQYLSKKHNLREIGVIITDSTTRPFQLGTTGLGIAYSGFKPLKSYVGSKDIFGRPLQFQQNNIMNGLAAAAVVAMGEGSEQTPIAVMNDLPFVQFQPRNPTKKELAALAITLENDVYAALLTAASWRKGRG